MILNYPRWICDDVRLSLNCRKKDEKGWNARSSGMKTTTKENAWLGRTKGDSRKTCFGFCNMRLNLTTEKIWFYNKKGDGTIEINELPK